MSNAAAVPEGLTSWCEIDVKALRANVACLRATLRPPTLLGIVVKSNAYGHGLVPCARIFAASGADWLVVNSAAEAGTLRAAGVAVPIYICARVGPSAAAAAVRADARAMVCTAADLEALGAAAAAQGRRLRVHLKLETGTHRQGADLDEAVALGRRIRQHPHLELEGLTTHLADVEDTDDHGFAHQQCARLREGAAALARAGIAAPLVHAASSAAALLWPEMHFQLVRVGIAAYGLWPSARTRVAAGTRARKAVAGPLPELVPALSWRTRVSLVRQVAAGADVGYGRTFTTRRPTRIAVLPVGYYEGFDRRLSNVGQVLIGGRPAPVCGRVCMNMTMVDVTGIPGVGPGTIATLIGRDGARQISADDLAERMGSISYEAVARIGLEQPRLFRLADGRLLPDDQQLAAALAVPRSAADASQQSTN